MANCANPKCLGEFSPDRYHPEQKYCSSACRIQHRNTVFGRRDREKWKQTHPGEYEKSRARHIAKVEASPELLRARRRLCRSSHLKRAYGITAEQKEARLAAQGNCCAACGSPNHEGRGWATDHDHKTGLLRGELCNRCNPALGFVKDNPEHLQKLIEYLIYWRNTHA